MTGPNQNANRVLRAWGANPPDWIVRLAQECDRTQSQAVVGEKLGVSAAAVNQALGRSYKGRMDRIEERVRGALMNASVICPVLGEIPRNECIGHQQRRFAATNPMRVRLFNACKTCPNREDACSSSTTPKK